MKKIEPTAADRAAAEAEKIKLRREKEKIKSEQAAKRKEEKARRAEEAAKRKEEEKKRKAEEAKRREEERAVIEEKNRIIAARRLERRKTVYAAVIKRLRHGDGAFCYRNYGVLPRVEIEVRGDVTSVLTRLGAAGVKAVDVKKSDGKFRFKVQKKDLSKAIAFLDEMCYNYILGETYGLPRVALYWLARAGLIVGAAASALAMYFSYSHIYAVHVSGNEKIREEAVLSALKAEGITVGTDKSEIDLDRVVAIVNGIDGIADCDCSLSGTALYVNVLESGDFTEIDSFGAYESVYDAVITRVVMRSGTSKVKRGDAVKKGDVLADGTVYSTAGEPLYTAECEGEIYGNVSIGYNVSVSPVKVVHKRTGKVYKKSAWTLFGKTFFKPRSPYDSYESFSYTASYDVLIPLYITTYEFYETERVETERTVEQAVAELAEEKREELGFFDRDKFEMTYTAAETDTGLINIHLFFSGEALISRGCAAPVANGNK
ncbi:MAG: sporulation protein YqfD [Clostridiales bacterium]|nr:sporulation protein YqfD [Clostridiales bacterium]